MGIRCSHASCSHAFWQIFNNENSVPVPPQNDRCISRAQCPCSCTCLSVRERERGGGESLFAISVKQTIRYTHKFKQWQAARKVKYHRRLSHVSVCHSVLGQMLEHFVPFCPVHLHCILSLTNCFYMNK